MYYTTITREYIDWHSYGHEWHKANVVFDEPLIWGEYIVTMSYTVSEKNNNNKIL